MGKLSVLVSHLLLFSAISSNFPLDSLADDVTPEEAKQLRDEVNSSNFYPPAFLICFRLRNFIAWTLWSDWALILSCRILLYASDHCMTSENYVQLFNFAASSNVILSWKNSSSCRDRFQLQLGSSDRTTSIWWFARGLDLDFVHGSSGQTALL